jgi:serine phosphatase RsbU (regulator of sigma subunit)
LLLEHPGIEIVTQSLPSRQDALIGGDFYDVVQTADRTVHVMIGDVAGHGPDAAALGMRQLDRILTTERPGTGVFATLLSLAIDPDSGRYAAVRAGHPGMLCHGRNSVEWIEPPAGPALGLGAEEWPVNQLQLEIGQGLLLLTDGLFEGHVGSGDERLGEAGLLRLARTLAGLPGREFVDALIGQAETYAQPHGGLTDDIAVIRVERSPG